jgi:hypothetical protein
MVEVEEEEEGEKEETMHNPFFSGYQDMYWLISVPAQPPKQRWNGAKR